MRIGGCAGVRGLLTVFVVCSALSGSGVAQQVAGSPDVTVSTADARISPGETTQLQLIVANDGSVASGGPAQLETRVQTAHGVSVEIRRGGAPIRVQTGNVPLGTLPPGRQQSVPIRLTVAEDADPGFYRIPVRISYDYTSSVSNVDNGTVADEASASVLRYVIVRVQQKARFRVVNASANVSAGDSGTLRLAIRNSGTADAFDAAVAVTSTDPELQFGGNATTAQNTVGEWIRKDTKYVRFPIRVGRDALSRNITAQVRVTYEDKNGVRQRSEPLFIGVRPRGQPTFAIRNVTSTVRVGDEGAISGRVINTGQRAENAVVVLQSNGTRLVPEETKYPIGTVPRNDSRDFRFDVDATNATNPGPREFVFRITYRGATGNRLASDPISVPVRVEPRREPFSVNATNATFAVDSSDTLRVNVTNTAGQRLSNVTARLLVSDPLSSDDDSTYIGVLAPNSSATAAFQLTVGGEAIPKRHPVAVVISYETPNGESREAGPYAVAVDVRREPGVGSSVISVAIAVAVLLLGIGWWLRQR
ncbi:COG1361 S-layer family protein [Haladaptatus sp. DFWS20]|uniref:COG1361 S-layer family protein n=1 Tax=Haladaptatus sp. DFWS20 TaxID=3403467 RepID=UPI003EC0492D